MDIASISATIGNIKTAWDISKQLRELDDSYKVADYKAEIVTLMGALTDAKMALVEVREGMLAQDERIKELEKSFELKEAMVRQGDAMYVVGGDGKPHGDPYCLRCWSADHKQRPLVSEAISREMQCPFCETVFNGGKAFRLP